MLFKELQPQNISVIFAVLIFDKSIVDKETQLLNKLFIFLTFSESKLK